MKTSRSIFGSVYIFLALFTCVFISSCNSGLSGVSDSGKPAASADGRAYISSVSLGNGERAIVPSRSFDLRGDEIYKFVLYRQTPGSGEREEVGTWIRTEEEVAYDIMDDAMRGGEVSIEAGTYNFTIQVYVSSNDGVSFEGDDDEVEDEGILVLEKTTDPVVVQSGSNKIRFGTLDEASGEGNLSLRLSFPDEGVKKVLVTLTAKDEGNTYSVTERSLDISDAVGGYRSVTFNDNPQNGWYVVKFDFTINNGAGDTRQTWSELVQIATGRQTTADIPIANLNAIYPIEYNCKGGKLKMDNVSLSYSPYQGAIPMPEVQERNVATFIGWYSDPNFQNRVTEIPAGSKGAKTFYAKWKYNIEDGKLYASGEKLIIKKSSDTVVYAYFDKVDEDNMVLNDDGGFLNIYNWEVYGSKKDGTYPEGTTDDITLESGHIIAIYARGNNGCVTVNDGEILCVKSEGEGGTVNIAGGILSGDYTNRTAIYFDDSNASLNITGGEISGQVRGNIASSTLINVSGAPVIGNGKDIGIDLSSARGTRIYAGNLNSAETESITLLAPDATDGTVMATFAAGATAFKDSFVIMNEKRKRVVEVVGQDIKVVGGLSLPSYFVETAENTYQLEHGNITIPGTIFSVFAEDGYFTLTETELAGNVHFDMGIPVDARGKEKQFVYDATVGEFYRYIQFTSTSGEISPFAADDFLTSIEFHKIAGKPITVRINLETVPITGEDYKLGTDLFYLDGSFYKKSEWFEAGTSGNAGKTWSQAYNEAKEKTFNGLQGYLMTITSDAENKFVYDQVFKAEKEDGKGPDDFGTWIGGTRQTSSRGYDATTWSGNGYNKYWSWACGPEAGKTFYTNTFARKNVSYRAEGMYSSWSNPEDCALNGIKRAYSDDFEPNNQSNNNYTGSDNSGSNNEFYTQYTGRYVWNDANGGTGTQDRWKVHYYVVEFTPYENKETGETYVSKKPRLHAEQVYD